LPIPDFQTESISHDPIHGTIAFSSSRGGKGEVTEGDLIDHPWVQRLRRIRQLQSAWWVFPSAEHTRFQHVLGAMHLGGRVASQLYDSLKDVCPNVPSKPYVVSLVRLAGLLHDVGHGPMGHFFDDQFLSRYKIHHEALGQAIITRQLGSMIRKVRANPEGRLKPSERLDPQQIAYLIRRPYRDDPPGMPRWLVMLRSLFSGAATVDNMDFVMRDSYMTGYRLQAFDLQRILHYSFFSSEGLTIHRRGVSALVNFLKTRSELFTTIYFHRTVRALDLAMEEVFGETMAEVFPSNPLRSLKAYQRLTDWSMLETVTGWAREGKGRRRQLGRRWQQILMRPVEWKLAYETTERFFEGESQRASIFADRRHVADKVRENLPARYRRLTFRVDVAEHHPRPTNPWADPASQNYVFDPVPGRVEPLGRQEAVAGLPTTEVICRLYSTDHRHDPILADGLKKLLAPGGDDKTNV